MRGVRLSHRPLRGFGLPEEARPLAARAIRDARLWARPLSFYRRHVDGTGRDMRGYLRSVQTLQMARELAQESIEVCTLDEDPEEYPPEHEGLWFETAVAIDNRLGVHGLTVEDAG